MTQSTSPFSSFCLRRIHVLLFSARIEMSNILWANGCVSVKRIYTEAWHTVRCNRQHWISATKMENIIIIRTVFLTWPRCTRRDALLSIDTLCKFDSVCTTQAIIYVASRSSAFLSIAHSAVFIVTGDGRLNDDKMHSATITDTTVHIVLMSQFQAKIAIRWKSECATIQINSISCLSMWWHNST